MAGLITPRLKSRLHPVIERVADHLPRPLEKAIHSNLGNWILRKRIRSEGLEFDFNIRAQEWFLLEDYETPVANWLARNVLPGHRCIDVGAHVGLFTVIMALFAGRDGQIDAVEPLQKNWQLLERNIEDNDLETVNCRLACCWRTVEEIPMFSGATSFESSVSQDFGHEAKLITTTTLDEIANGQKVDLIKIDVEGAEAEVLEGAQALLRTSKPKLIVEIHPALRLATALTVPTVLRPFAYQAFTPDGRALDTNEINALSQNRSLDPFHVVFT